MQGPAGRKKLQLIKMENQDKSNVGDLLSLAFSWSAKDILDANLYKEKVKEIPEQFSSVEEYLNSFKIPLTEEIRADFCSALESVAKAPACEMRNIKFSKDYKPPKDLYYDVSIGIIIDNQDQGEPYKPESGDVLVLTKKRPKRLQDVIRPVEPLLLAYVHDSDEESQTILMLTSQNLEPDSLQRFLFGTYLVNMTTSMRIWKALHPDPKSNNLGLIEKVLRHEEHASDGDCSICLSVDNPTFKVSDVLDMIGKFGLNEAQQYSVLASASMSKCLHQMNRLKLIWGPPGTGKTKTVAALLFALLKLECRTVTCAPTNTAVLQVADRLVKIVRRSLECDTYGLGDIVLFGNKKRMKVDDYSDLEDVFLEYRCKILADCLRPFSGWSYTLESMITLLQSPRKCYSRYLNQAMPGKPNDATGKLKTEKPMTFKEFLRKTFYSNRDRLIICAQNLYTHLPTSCISLLVAKKMISLVRLFKTFEKLRKKVGPFPELMNKKDQILKLLRSLKEHFATLDLGQSIWGFCLMNAHLIFCTASSTIKVRYVNTVIIDEAAQLKECESAIPLQISGLKNAILVGDDRQLPAMVRSKVLEGTNFGRSMFQRLGTLGKEKHLLNIQYRMHPSISLFPNHQFYEDKIVDGPNVMEQSYAKIFLDGKMFGSYSFINVAKGQENFKKGPSPRNFEEAAVVDKIITKLYNWHCYSKQKISVGVISPYKGQVGQIQERLGKKYDYHRRNGFSVSVRSVDGFQGGEEDVIIISTVRSNGSGSVGFLSNHQRTNVALTRARYCLWIVGSGATLGNSDTIWRDLVIDAKTRGCYHDADEGFVLNSNGTSELDSKLVMKGKWKILYSDAFKNSIRSLKSIELQKQVTEMLQKLADGWRQGPSDKAVTDGVSSELLELYKVDDQLYLAWAVEILKENSKCTQAIKVWDILLASNIQILCNKLNDLFGSYTVDFMNRCKQKALEGNLVVPVSWPLHSVSSSAHLAANPYDCLSGNFASLNLRDDQGFSRNKFQSKLKKGTRTSNSSRNWNYMAN